MIRLPSLEPRACSILIFAAALALSACCREPYELIVERSEDDVDRSCMAVCFDAVTPESEADASGQIAVEVMGCDDIVYDDGRDMISCALMRTACE